MRRFATLLLITFAATSIVAAPESSSAPMRQADPKTEAAAFYQSGERRLDKIGKLVEEMKTADAEKSAKIQEKIRKGLEAAANDFRRAIQKDRNLFQAHSELGFALRKLGQYDASLAAYNEALRIQPNYAPAIEYRAEAYLGLGKVEEAKQAYLLLFNGDRPRADLLFEAMRTWATAHRDDPDAADFVAWVDQRAALHQGAPMASSELRTW